MNTAAFIWAVLHLGTAPLFAADPVSDALSRLVLQNEQGLNEPPKDTFKQPLGVLVTFVDDKWKSLCNASSGRASATGGWIFTARHCWPRVAQGQRARVFFVGFHARTGKQTSIELAGTPIALQLTTADEKKFDADVLKVAVPVESARTFAQSDILAPTKRDPTREKLTAWVYRFDRESDANPEDGSGPVSLTLTSFRLESRTSASPAFQVKQDSLFRTYYLSYSKQGRKLEEGYSIYLDGKLPPESSSGGLVFDDKNAPAGIFHSIVSAKTFRDSWDLDLSFRFERAATEEGVAFDETKLRFALVTADGAAHDFDPKTDKKLYGVALDLGAAQETLQRSGSKFLDR